MTKKLIILIILCSFSGLLFAQDTITVYYDNTWVEISNKDEAVFYRKAYVDSDKVWQVKDYYISGKIQMTGSYKSRKLTIKNGHFVYYFETGNKSSEGTYVNNKEEGVWTYWLENGDKKSEGEFKAGMEEGIWEYWYETGEKKSEGKFLEGEKAGTWNYYYSNGNLKSTETYSKVGTFTYEEFYDNGAPSIKGNCVNYKPQGTWMYWNSDGRINLKGNYNQGLRDGVWIRSFQEGEMKIIFNNGVSEGKQLGGIVRNE